MDKEGISSYVTEPVSSSEVKLSLKRDLDLGSAQWTTCDL